MRCRFCNEIVYGGKGGYWHTATRRMQCEGLKTVADPFVPPHEAIGAECANCNEPIYKRAHGMWWYHSKTHNRACNIPRPIATPKEEPEDVAFEDVG